jgi:hypothetical protein
MLFATINTTMSFDFPSPFFCDEHKRGKGIATVLMRKGYRIFGCETTKNIELMELYHEHRITTINKHFEACFESILFSLFGLPTKVDSAP